MSVLRDDAFSDSLSQKADSEASSGPHQEDRASSRNDRRSPCEHTPEHRFGAALGRYSRLHRSSKTCTCVGVGFVTL